MQLLVLLYYGLDSFGSVKIQAIYHEYRYLMKKVALSYFRDPFAAEDVVSLSLVKLKNYLPRIPDIPSPSAKSYIVRVVKSVSVDYKRQLDKNPSLSLDQLLEDFGFDQKSEAPSVEEMLILDESVKHIKAALEKLDKRQHDAVLYHKYFGLTLRETADRMRIASTSTVQYLCQSGLDKLKEAMLKGGGRIAK